MMRMIDSVALAEAAQDALDRFGEVTACVEFRAWPFMAAARHAGWARPNRRRRCVAGHWYYLETLAPTRTE
jgi:hypothetical protein